MKNRCFGSLRKASMALLAGFVLVALSGCYYPYYYSHPYGHGAGQYKHGAGQYKHGYHGKRHYGGGSYNHRYRDERRKRYRYYHGY